MFAAALALAARGCQVLRLNRANIADQNLPSNNDMIPSTALQDPAMVAKGEFTISDAKDVHGIWTALTGFGAAPWFEPFLDPAAKLQIGGDLQSFCPLVANLPGYDSCLRVGWVAGGAAPIVLSLETAVIVAVSTAMPPAATPILPSCSQPSSRIEKPAQSQFETGQMYIPSEQLVTPWQI